MRGFSMLRASSARSGQHTLYRTIIEPALPSPQRANSPRADRQADSHVRRAASRPVLYYGVPFFCFLLKVFVYFFFSIFLFSSRTSYLLLLYKYTTSTRTAAVHVHIIRFFAYFFKFVPVPVPNGPNGTCHGTTVRVRYGMYEITGYGIPAACTMLRNESV